MTDFSTLTDEELVAALQETVDAIDVQKAKADQLSEEYMSRLESRFGNANV